MAGFLSLPRELRDQICTHAVDKPTNAVTVFEEQRCLANDVSAAQPAISRVNKEIRAEVLPLFYKRNVFLAELSLSVDLENAKKWLRAIGDANVGCLRWLTLCGWRWVYTRDCCGVRKPHCAFWVQARFDLMQGELEIDGEKGSEVWDRNPGGTEVGTRNVGLIDIREVRKHMKQLRQFYQGMVEERRREGKKFDVESLSGLMEVFHAFCKEHGLGNLDGELAS